MDTVPQTSFKNIASKPCKDYLKLAQNTTHIQLLQQNHSVTSYLVCAVCDITIWRHIHVFKRSLL